MKTFGTTETFIPGQKSLSGEYYTSNEIFELEKERVFGGWVCLGHMSRIPKPGNYFVIDVLGESLIVVRDMSQEIHAYHNVCSHRGTKMFQENGGKACETQHQTLKCPYHSWAYFVADGFLIKPDSMKGVEGFNAVEHGLTSVPVYVWEGLIFVNFAKKPVPFEKAYAPLIGKFSKWNMANLKLFEPMRYVVEANHKHVVQNFSECDHCPSIHPELNRRLTFTGSQNDLTEGPILGGYFTIKGESMTMSGRRCARLVGDLGDDVDKAYYYSIMPNLLLGIHPDYVIADILLPISPSVTVVVSEWLFNPASFNDADFFPRDAIKFWDITNTEDWEACKWMQQGVSLKAHKPGWYSKRESLLQAYDRYYLGLMKQTSWWLAPPRGFGQFSRPR